MKDGRERTPRADCILCAEGWPKVDDDPNAHAIEADGVLGEMPCPYRPLYTTPERINAEEKANRRA